MLFNLHHVKIPSVNAASDQTKPIQNRLFVFVSGVDEVVLRNEDSVWENIYRK